MPAVQPTAIVPSLREISAGKCIYFDVFTYRCAALGDALPPVRNASPRNVVTAPFSGRPAVRASFRCDLRRALPSALDCADALVEPFVLRDFDIVFARKTANRSGEFLDFGLAMRDTVLRHRGHADAVESFDKLNHLGEIAFGERDALGLSDRKSVV